MSSAELYDLDRPWCFKEFSSLIAVAQRSTGFYLIFDDPVLIANHLAVGKVCLGAHLAQDFEGAVRFLAASTATVQRYLSLSLTESNEDVELVLTPNLELGPVDGFIQFFMLVTTARMLRFLSIGSQDSFSLHLASTVNGDVGELRTQCQQAAIHFSGDKTFIRFPKSLNTLRMANYSERKLVLAKREYEVAVQLPYCQITWGERVRVVLLAADLNCSAENAALSLGVSVKTLSNYLAKEGLSFSELRTMMKAERRILEHHQAAKT
ncbi:hypothetical protein [uncultured Umboniibacter sp.]|uniref:hypothetical protein n=1 Tax=uncultured Umboniibacter sp. TaxID=1798917 RepID=UPI00261B1AF5|nr:hypothetical protein [uncultured Umboniibacter sp.]